MKILVTGSLGQLGREVGKQLATPEHLRVSGKSGPWIRPEEILVTGVDLGDLDIGDLDATLAFCRKLKPDAIINCAAFTAVDACESDPDAAYRANAIGPRNLAMAAAETGAKLIHVSTDYVFDGNGVLRNPAVKAISADSSSTGNVVGMDASNAGSSRTDPKYRPYHEFDAPNPQSVYGRSKLAGEKFVREFCSRWFILRTAWLYGDGKNFVKTMLKLADGHDEVRVVADQHGTPTSARALAACMLELVQTEAYGAYHATCEGETTWHGFAEEIFRQRGLGTKVIPLTTEEFPTPTPRPKYSVLDNSMLRMGGFKEFPAWQDELRDYLKTLA